MLHTLVGADAWYRGMALYFARYDGKATTCEAFLDCMQAVSEIDLTQFRLWYSTAGTPTLHVLENYDETSGRLTLDVRQSIPSTSPQAEKPPLHIPIVLALLDEEGQSIPLSIGREVEHGVLVDLTETQQEFIFEDIATRPLVSFLRNFSAPVRLDYAVDDVTLSTLLARDSDGFNRWDAGMRLVSRVVLGSLEGEVAMSDSMDALLTAFDAVLIDAREDPSFSAELLTMPSFDSLADTLLSVDVHALLQARQVVAATIASRFADRLKALAMPPIKEQTIGGRRLAGVALKLLAALPQTQWQDTAEQAWSSASNMTESVQALSLLCQGERALRQPALDAFYERWSANRLVIDKWFAIQASSERDDVLDDVNSLLQHPDFDLGNPNRVRSLIGMFAAGNPTGFHDRDGRGYQLLADHVIALNERNPQTAAGLLSPLCRWRQFAEPYAQQMHGELERIAATPSLSPDVYELVSKSLQSHSEK